MEKRITKINLKALLDQEVQNRNLQSELSDDKPDPLMIAKKYNDEYISLICALFAYGNAGQIVKLLKSFDFDILTANDDFIKESLKNHYYRFQTNTDIINFFIALKQLKEKDTLENIFKKGYNKEHNVIEGITSIINSIKEMLPYNSQGYNFLIGNEPKRDKNGDIKLIGNGAYKRYNMFLRWVVRSDNLDMGLWSSVDKQDLIIPLDTHLFKVSQKLGLLTRKTADLKSAFLITDALKQFDGKDPLKYDFAIYRLGQEKIIKI